MKGSMEEILRFVEQNDAFSIISHVAPDGDTIGSGTALSRILRRLGKRTENVCCDQVPDAYKFIPGAEEMLLPEDAHFCVKSKDAADAVQERFHLRGQTPCAQWVYTKKDAPIVPGLEGADIRPLPEEDIPTAAPHYHDSADYLRERSQAGELWGIYEKGKLAGFMGLHEEGSMGILAILPEFRRRGLASVLESWVIGQQLKQGQVPYGHVIEGNDASTALQESLGLTKAELPAIWVF